LRDLGSTNGVYLVRNNRAIPVKQVFVKPNQPILIGRHSCTVQGLLNALIDVENYDD
jgi:pSer/pThr/pTyr-binding forkhead associated (FHA) protein